MPRAKSHLTVIHIMRVWVQGHFANNDTFLMPRRVSLYVKLTVFIICSTSEFQKENMKRNAKESAEFHTVPFCRIEVCADKWMLQRRQQSACASRQCTAPSSAPRPTLQPVARHHHHQQHQHWHCYLDQNKSERRVFFFQQATR